jgi:hypothetical protein
MKNDKRYLVINDTSYYELIEKINRINHKTIFYDFRTFQGFNPVIAESRQQAYTYASALMDNERMIHGYSTPKLVFRYNEKTYNLLMKQESDVFFRLLLKNYCLN